jgi:DNA-binding response OmpR family regulator
VRVLLIEDSERLRRVVSASLKKSGYAVDATADGEDGWWLAQTNDYDVVVLDIMLPGIDGLEVLRRLRAQQKTTHVLLLTARGALEDRVRGLQSGADDYLVKPFALEELLARVQALCRRSYGQKCNVLTFGGIELDLTRKTASHQGQPLDLSARELMLLEYLAHRRGDVVSRREIEQHIYDDQVEPMSNVVDSAVCVLRKKLARLGAGGLIKTRRGLGYVLEAAE